MAIKVGDLLQSKGPMLLTVTPEDRLEDAARLMVERNVGSLVVVANERVVGVLTFREVLASVLDHGGFGDATVYRNMDAGVLICTPGTDVEQARSMMIKNHARYLPVVEAGKLLGVIGFHDIAKTVVDRQQFENSLLKAYIRDWPDDDAADQKK